MKRWLLVVVVVACGSSSAPTPSPCADAAELRAWLANLAADDQSKEMLDGLKLAALDAYPTPAPDAVRITIAACVPPYECPKGDVLVASRGELYGGAEPAGMHVCQERSQCLATNAKAKSPQPLGQVVVTHRRTTAGKPAV